MIDLHQEFYNALQHLNIRLELIYIPCFYDKDNAIAYHGILGLKAPDNDYYYAFFTHDLQQAYFDGDWYSISNREELINMIETSINKSHELRNEIL